MTRKIYFRKTKAALQLFTIAMLLFAFKANAQCPTGNVTLTTQAQVDQFIIDYPNCTQITGYLAIGVTSGTSNITDLSPLNNLISIGSFIQVSNTSLTNLGGLNNLTSIGTAFIIMNNASLTSINGLNALAHIGNALDIRQNPNLENVGGFSNLTSVGGYMYFNDTKVVNVTGLNNLSSVGSFMIVDGNTNLTNVGFLSNLTSVGGSIAVRNNAQLQNLNGFSNVSTVGGRVQIVNNAILNNISGLQNIAPSTISENGLIITNNPALSVCNLPNFCSYLANPASTHPRNISGNLANCLNETAVRTACGLMSVMDIDKSNISVYPNPVKGLLNFSEEVSNVKITDVSGRTVKHISATGKSVNVADLAKGTYIISAVTKSGETVSKKIVKE